MIGVPQLRCDKDVLTRNPSGSDSCVQRLAYLTLVPVSFRTIKMSKSSFQGLSGRTNRRRCIGNQSAKAEYRHMADSMVERKSCSPKIRRFDHDGTSLISSS